MRKAIFSLVKQTLFQHGTHSCVAVFFAQRIEEGLPGSPGHGVGLAGAVKSGGSAVLSLLGGIFQRLLHFQLSYLSFVDIASML
jgi:hypothetical protein